MNQNSTPPLFSPSTTPTKISTMSNIFSIPWPLSLADGKKQSRRGLQQPWWIPPARDLKCTRSTWSPVMLASTSVELSGLLTTWRLIPTRPYCSLLVSTKNNRYSMSCYNNSIDQVKQLNVGNNRSRSYDWNRQIQNAWVINLGYLKAHNEWLTPYLKHYIGVL